MNSNTRLLKSSFLTAIATFLSRLLGLVRTILMAHILGGGVIMTAWTLAFTVANLFRRLFGEGVVGSAIVPFIRHSIESEGEHTAREKLSLLVAALTCLMFLICIIVAGGALISLNFAGPERLKLTFKLIPVIIPYALMICISGVISSVLNTIGKFFLPALSAIILNIFLICALLFVKYFPVNNGYYALITLAVSVVASGILQLYLLCHMLKQSGFFPVFRKMQINEDILTLKDFGKMAAPGLIGASALQISMLIDKAFGCMVGDYGAPSLMFSDRIVYLPIGVFAVSMGAVTLSDMSKSAARGERKNMLLSMELGIRQLLYICIPIALFTFFYRAEIIKLIYIGGKFGVRELNETAVALKFYAFGIPLFAIVKITVGAFYAEKDMKTPVKISLICIVINIILNIILIYPLKQGGVALATVISSALNNFLLILVLHRIFKKKMPDYSLSYLGNIGLGAFKASVITVAALALIYFFISRNMPPELLSSRWTVLLHGTSFIFLFMMFSFILRVREFTELLNSVKSIVKYR